MLQSIRRWALALAMSVAATPALAADVEWPVYGGDLGSRKYAPLDQINAQSIQDLEIAWVWASPDNAILQAEAATRSGVRTDHFKGTPIMVGGRLFIRTQLGILEAIDPETGRTLWRSDPGGYRAAVPKSYGFTTRGVAHWRAPDGSGARILSTTADRRLIARDAATGAAIAEFGEGGAVSLDAGLRRIGADPSFMNYGNQVPVIIGDVVVVGSVVTDAELSYLPRDRMGRPNIPVGDVRGYDVRTGKLLWTFHTVPQAGEFGVETWEEESWRWVGSTNVWSLMSADPELGYVYLPVSAPTFNYYGGFRKGDNLYGQSIVCLDARTGKRVWHFQTVRHPVFDYDMAAAPVLADITVDGRAIPAVVAFNKTGFLYVLDRRTGAPVWPIVDRAVPQSTVPGERTAATQPFPTKPPPVALQGLSERDLLSLTPALRAEAEELIAGRDYGPLFTPVSRRGTVLSPGISGGVNWPGGAFDPGSGRLFVTAINEPMIRALTPAENHYGYSFRRFGSRVRGLPLVNPPWGTLTAVDLNRGDIAWQVANGPGPKNHPDLKPLALPDLGAPSKSNPLVTASLVFAAGTGEGSFGPPWPAQRLRIAPSVPPDLVAQLELNNGAMMRAFDKASGRVVWEHPIGPSFNDGGAPMTYQFSGRQYLITPAGGGLSGSYLIAFALPQRR